MKKREADAEPGLRERKKQRTRLAISEVATRLFIERGFDAVTIAEVAEAAEVSVNTVFNYFAAKEDLLFDRAREVEQMPSRIVRERRPGESAIEALERAVLEGLGKAAGTFREGNRKAFVATVDASPALRARARVMAERAEDALARTLTEETGAKPDAPAARAVAAMAIALLWLIAEQLRDAVLRGEPPERSRPRLVRTCRQGFALLREGAGDFARKPREPKQ